MPWIILLIVQFLDALFNRWRISRLKAGEKLNHWVNVGYRSAIGLFLIEIFKIHGARLTCFFIGAFFGYKLLFDIEENLLNKKPALEPGKTGILDKIQNWSGIPLVAITFWELVIASGFIYSFYHTDLL